jgi:prepilin-type N-terminal cleavage/methylation domain-containing protein
MPSNRAFTLLELLVVITIIGILSSIVIVSMSGSTAPATIAKGKAYSQQVHALLGSNAVGVWNFDEGTGTIVYDISGYENNGVIYGASYISSPVGGNALNFNGSSDYINCGNYESLNVDPPITYESWVDVSSSFDAFIVAYFMSKGSGSVAGINFGFSGTHITEHKGKVIIYNGSFSIYSINSVSNNVWHHLVATNDGTTSKIYIDGQFSNSGIQTITNNPDLNLNIGRRANNQFYFPGFIDDVRIYSEALPATEIQKHYVQGLNKLLTNQVITQTEYDQRMEEFNQYLVSNKF